MHDSKSKNKIAYSNVDFKSRDKITYLNANNKDGGSWNEKIYK